MGAEKVSVATPNVMSFSAISDWMVATTASEFEASAGWLGSCEHHGPVGEKGTPHADPASAALSPPSAGLRTSASEKRHPGALAARDDTAVTVSPATRVRRTDDIAFIL